MKAITSARAHITIALSSLTLMFFGLSSVNAQSNIPNPGGGGQNIPNPGGGGQNIPNPSQTGDQLRNPIAGVGSVNELLVTLLNVLIVIMTPIVVIFIILAGFKYVTAQGDATKITEAKRALIYAIIGGVLIVGATAVAEIISGTIDAFRTNP